MGCLKGGGLRLGDIDAFFLEAENDFEDPAISMESLLARLIDCRNGRPYWGSRSLRPTLLVWQLHPSGPAEAS